MIKNYKFGYELEFGDESTDKGVPIGFSGFSTQEHDLVSIKPPYRGLANDPRVGSKHRTHTIGGELNTIPTDTIDGQIEAVHNFLAMYPNATVNCRTDSHYHISLPEFKTDVELCKKVLTYIRNNIKSWLDRVYPHYSHPDMTRGDRQFININSKIMPEWRYQQIMSSTTVAEFIRNHSLDTKGNYNARMGTRYPMNMIAIHDHGSIECRVNYGTLDPKIIKSHFELLKAFIDEALGEQRDFNIIIDEFEANGHEWSKCTPYDHEIQCGYRFCNYPTFKNDMVKRWKLFRTLWDEDKSRFFQENWYKQEWAGIPQD